MISRQGRYLLADSTSQCITSAPFSQRVKEVVAAASAILVAGILHMGAWLRWPAALIADKDAHEAVLGTALAVTLFWGVTFPLMLVSTYLPAALVLAKRAAALLQERSSQRSVPKPQEWRKDNGLFLSLQGHFPQFGLMLAPPCLPAP
jgi:hypothetical protein